MTEINHVAIRIIAKVIRLLVELMTPRFGQVMQQGVSLNCAVFAAIDRATMFTR